MKTRIVLYFILPALCLATTTEAGRGQEGVREITLDEAVQLFLANNLELKDGKLEIEKARGERTTAGLWANPWLSYSREAVSFGDHKESEDVIGLEYEFDLFGKRSLRRKAADYAVSAAESEFAHNQAVAVAELKRAYVMAVLTKRRVALLEDTAGVFERAVDVGRARFEEGDISGFDELRLAAEGARYARELAAARIEYANLQRQLGVLLAPEGETLLFEPTDDLTYPAPDLTQEQLLEEAFRERPDLRRMEYAARAAHETVRCEKREKYPAVSLLGGYKRQSDDFTGSAIEVSLALPVFDRNQGDVAVARAELLRLETRRALLERQVRAQVETAYIKIKTLESLLRHLDKNPSAKAEEISKIAGAAYAEGEMSLLELLDAAEASYEAQFSQSEREAEYVLSLIELELAVGGGVH